MVEMEAAATSQEITATQAPFLLEIGTEELPPGDMTSALSQLETAVPVLLDDLRLGHGEVKVMGTPRRLVVFVADLQTRQDDRVVEVKGPPANRAFDADGNPTRAAKGSPAAMDWMYRIWLLRKWMAGNMWLPGWQKKAKRH